MIDIFEFWSEIGRGERSTLPTETPSFAAVGVFPRGATAVLKITSSSRQRNRIGRRKGVLEGFVERLFLVPTLIAIAIVLIRFAFRIGNHFGFSDDANFCALINERYPALPIDDALFDVLIPSLRIESAPGCRRIYSRITKFGLLVQRDVRRRKWMLDAGPWRLRRTGSDSWKRDDFIKDTGYATFPGSEYDRKVANACVELLTQVKG